MTAWRSADSFRGGTHDAAGAGDCVGRGFGDAPGAVLARPV